MNLFNRGRILFSAAVLFVFVCAPRCSREEAISAIKMPTTPVLSLQANWGTVSSPYLGVRSRPQGGAEIVGHLGNASVVEILSKTAYSEMFDGESNYWYEISADGIRGWVFGSHLEFHHSRQDAERGGVIQ